MRTSHFFQYGSASSYTVVSLSGPSHTSPLILLDSDLEVVLGDFYDTSFGIFPQLQVFRYIYSITAMLPILN